MLSLSVLYSSSNDAGGSTEGIVLAPAPAVQGQGAVAAPQLSLQTMVSMIVHGHSDAVRGMRGYGEALQAAMTTSHTCDWCCVPWKRDGDVKDTGKYSDT